jgi:predicted chitinase
MTTINISQIQKLAPNLAQSYAAAFSASDVAAILAQYGISKSALRVCHFLAQAMVETGYLRSTTENLNYSAAQIAKVWPTRFPNAAAAQPYANNPEKLSNSVYGGRMGNTQDGDGYRFRGRGLLQITGRSAYTKYGNQLGVSLAANPDLAFDSAYCLEVAAAEWAASGYNGQFCNDLADLDDIYGVTRAINGGLTDIDGRIAALKQCKAIWLAAAPAEAPALASAAHAHAEEFAAGEPLPSEKFALHSYAKTGAESVAPPPADGAIPDDLRGPAPYFKRPKKAFGARVAGAPTSWNIADLCKAYDWPSRLAGGGRIAIVELDGGYAKSDLDAFFARNNLPSPTITDVLVYPDSGNNPGQHIGEEQDPDIEVTMDIEVAAAAYSLATGKPADIRVYWSSTSPGGIADAVRKATADGCDVCSISWGADEARWQLWSTSDHHYLLEMEAAAQNAAAQGMIVFAASGDNDSQDGGDDPANVDAPSSCPSVVGCGGTTKTRGMSVVWNDSPGKSDGNGTGGGFSRYFSRPAWQALAPADTDGAVSQRMVPDVAANADPYTGYNLVIHGQSDHFGGTSAVAPLYAGLFAAFGQKLGSVSQRLWANANSFTNITQGDNGAYCALAGPDPCTGLGVPIGTKLEAVFTAASQQPAPALALLAPRAGAPQPFDPLTAVQYGLFIDAAYSMYDYAKKNNSTPTPPPQSDFPPGFQLVAWVQMQDFIVLSTPPQFYGFIAQSINNPSRFVLALRGTEDPTEWFDNITSIIKVPFRAPGCGSVSFGFNRIYNTMEIIEAASPRAGMGARAAGSLRAAGGFSKQAAALMRKHAPAQARAGGAPLQLNSIEVAAHSLGGALATLYVLDNAKNDKIPNQVLYTFASPMVGDATFAAAFDGLGLTSWRIVNKQDLVPQLPSEFFGYKHVGVEQAYDSTGLVQANPSCWHAMATYLALIDHTRQPDPGCQVQAVAAQAAFLTPDAVAPALVSPAVDTDTNVTRYLPTLAAAGVTAVGRYYSVNKSKLLTLTEAEAITNAGLSIFAVYEDGNDPTKFTANLGTFQAEQALICAREVGQPQGSTIYFAVDFDCTATQFQQQITPFFTAINAVFAGQGFPFKIGVYGSGLVCQGLLAAGLCSYTWLTNSTGFQGYQHFYASKRWNLAQHLPKYYGKLQADPNETGADFGAFRVGAAAPAFAARAAVLPAGPTPWMDWMRAHRGEIQQTGAKPTPFTEAIFQHTDYGPLKGYTPASCAATICAALELTGYKSTHDASAVSYRDYGDPCELKPGCIVVYQWPNKDHHADFCDAIVDAETVRGLGGNQGHQLQDSDYSRRYIVATRWPVPAEGNFPGA